MVQFMTWWLNDDLVAKRTWWLNYGSNNGMSVADQMGLTNFPLFLFKSPYFSFHKCSLNFLWNILFSCSKDENKKG